MERSNKLRGLLVSTMASVMFGTLGLANPAASTGNPDSSDRALLAMTIETPTGSLARLTYRPGNGWSFDDYAGSVALNVTGLSAPDPRPEDGPMTVFIDGPTGYTYVWTPDNGWKFVGFISDKNR
jgi:hypothetical protein